MFADVPPAFNTEDLFDVDLELMAFLIDFCIVNWIDRIRFSNVARGFLAFYFFFVRGDNASVRTDNFGIGVIYLKVNNNEPTRLTEYSIQNQND